MRDDSGGPSKLPRGLTLIEIVVTIAIIGVIVAFALPAMRELSVAPDAGPLEPARALLVSARREAAKGSEVDVIIVPASGRYRIVQRRAGSDPVAQDGVLRLSNVSTRGPEDRFHVTFRPVGFGLGDTPRAGNVVLRVEGSSGRGGSRALTLLPPLACNVAASR